MPELIYDLPFPDYLNLDRLSSSGLKDIDKNPAYFDYRRKNPSPSNPSQSLGTHTHGLVLQPETHHFAVPPDVDRRTKKGKMAWEEFIAGSQGALVVTMEQHEKALAMQKAVIAHPYARALLGAGKPEVSALWDQFGAQCKARFDWLPDEFDVLVDLKTCSDASPTGFAKACGNWSYHIQAALYSMAAEACGLGKRPMIFIAVENEPPHLVGLYVIDDQALIAAEYKIERLIEQYAECRERNDWPGYSKEIETLELPKWAY